MSNDFELALQNTNKPQAQNSAVQTTIGRYTQEVQGMVFMAKQYPRDTFQAWQRIKEACSRKTLAEVSSYTYPRGGQNVSGPSIRLAEVLAQNWGNMTYGIMELEQKNGESQCLAYAWDLETNVRSEMLFTVKHERKTKREGIKKLDDPRDIYEMTANQGARRVRSRILAIIPKDIVDAAVAECEKTLKGDNKEPISDLLKRMLDKFLEFGVTKEMIEKQAGFKFESFTMKNVIELGKIYNSLKDGMAKREDFFEVEKPAPESSKLEEEFKQQQKQKDSGNAADGDNPSLFDAEASKALDAQLAEEESKNARK